MRKTCLPVAMLILICFFLPAHAFDELASHEVSSNIRFYSVKAMPCGPDGRLNIIAAGQIKNGDGDAALMIAFSFRDGVFKEIARNIFLLNADDHPGKTRIRSLIAINRSGSNQYFILVNGKGGPPHREKAFIRSYSFEGTFQLIDEMVFSDPEKAYTHGYPMIEADVDGDAENEIVFGGFSGNEDHDHADIRVFSIGERGHLARKTSLRTHRLRGFPLRVNALASGDLTGDGAAEVVAAGRTVENDQERGAFLVISKQNTIWKHLKDTGSCRYRAATVADMTGDGRQELILGGRIDQGGDTHALLDVWRIRHQDAQLLSRYRFTGAGSTRLRVLARPSGNRGRLIMGGRMETLQGDRKRWKGFLQETTFRSGHLSSSSKTLIFDKGWETRVRAIDVVGNFVTPAGFAVDKTKASKGFISVCRLP
jgi:hypothetical protein